jgi:hypothetical protein
MPPLAILDIDGTLAESPPVLVGRQRKFKLTQWEDRIRRDGVSLPAASDALHWMPRLSGVAVALVTARRKHLESVTRLWLSRHFPGLASAQLLMRANSVDGAVLRRQQIRSLWHEASGPVFVLDDRPVDLDLLGLTIFRAPDQWSDFIEAVHAH